MIEGLVVSLVLSQWSPLHLKNDLYSIAKLESSFGKNVVHQPDPRGPTWTAIGALGLKPVSAFDSYRNIKWFSAKYPGLTVNDFVEKLQNDRVFYIDACNAHWDYIRSAISTMTRIVYAWRWGIRAAMEADWSAVAYDPYVVNYMAMR